MVNDFPWWEVSVGAYDEYARSMIQKYVDRLMEHLEAIVYRQLIDLRPALIVPLMHGCCLFDGITVLPFGTCIRLSGSCCMRI